MSTSVPIPCFVVERNGRVARWLRRYTSSVSGQPSTCEGGHHQAWKRVDDADIRLDNRGMIINGPHERHDFAEADWPMKCDDCDFEFERTGLDNVTYQLFVEPLYVRTDGELGGPWISRWRNPKSDDTPPGLPPGAMYYADWNDFWVGPDGRCLVVIIPTDVPEAWMPDGPSSSGGHWTRTGTPPNVTVTPSIHAVDRGYHGHLTNGVLTPG